MTQYTHLNCVIHGRDSQAVTEVPTEFEDILFTVEPLNNVHLGTRYFWHNFTVIQRLSSLRGKIIIIAMVL